jgi:hypothetical protein
MDVSGTKCIVADRRRFEYSMNDYCYATDAPRHKPWQGGDDVIGTWS